MTTHTGFSPPKSDPTTEQSSDPTLSSGPLPPPPRKVRKEDDSRPVATAVPGRVSVTRSRAAASGAIDDGGSIKSSRPETVHSSKAGSETSSTAVKLALAIAASKDMGVVVQETAEAKPF